MSCTRGNMRRGKIRLVYVTRFQRDFGKISRFQRVSGFHGEFRGISGEVYEISRSGGPLELGIFFDIISAHV